MSQIARPAPLGLKGLSLFLKPAPAPTPAPTSAPARPAAMAVDTPPAPSTLIQVPGLQAGQTLKVENGSYQGTGFGGRAMVNAYDGKTLDLTLDAQAMVFVRVKVRLRFEMQPDGSVSFIGQQIKNGETPIASRLTIQSQQAGQTVFTGPDGQPILLAATPNGGVAIRYGDYAMTLVP